ncbi:MAG: sulfatase [Acidobacteriota bacterium]|nr:MAG: sulfatase [Acidobacteriota bacterium]
MRRSWAAFSLVLAMLILSGCAGEQPKGLPAQPHPIVVFDIGTLRADHLGCYGYERPVSPNIDALAGESVRFEWAFAQAPHTAPAQASLLTGLYPSTHGMLTELNRLPAAATTLAEALAEHGYLTAAFVDGGYVSDDFGFDQGFTQFENFRGAGLEEIGPEAIAWLRANAGESFLLLIHTYDTHTPYDPPPSHRQFLEGLEPATAGFAAPAEQMEAARAAAAGGTRAPLAEHDLEFAKALYDGEIQFVDSWIGKIIEELRQLGLDQRATIVLVSDHGEEFQEHGTVLHDRLYTTITRVPLLMRLPGGQSAGVVSQVVESIDVKPTLLELAGAELPPGIQGESLLPLIRGEGQPPFLAYGESTFHGGERFISMGGYQLIHNLETDAAELYHFSDDPLELKAVDDSGRAEALRVRLDEWQQKVARAALGQEQAPMDEDTLEQLRSLGYVQ